MTRLQAATTHLLISLTLSTIVICLLIFGWYPLPFFWALGGMMLLALIVGIDVVLGPLMTMILFNPKKSRRALTIDLTLIGIVQISALCYGLYSGYVSRLVFTVYDGQQFRLVQAGDVAPDFLKKATLPEYSRLAFASQSVAALSIPADERTQSDLAFFKAFGVGPQFMPQYYVPLSAAREQLLHSAISQEQLQGRHPQLANRIKTLLGARSWQDIAVIPFDVKTTTYTAIVDLQQGALLKVLNADPL